MIRIDEYVIGLNTQKGAQELSHPTVRLMRNHMVHRFDLDPEFTRRRLCTAIKEFGSAVAHRDEVVFEDKRPLSTKGWSEPPAESANPGIFPAPICPKKFLEIRAPGSESFGPRTISAAPSPIMTRFTN